MVENHYPEIPAGWRNGADPPYPGGERQADVHARLMSLIADLSRAAGTSLCITHNNVLRFALGSHFNVPSTRWHLIDVPHVQPFVSHFVGGRLAFHLSPQRLGVILDLRASE